MVSKNATCQTQLWDNRMTTLDNEEAIEMQRFSSCIEAALCGIQHTT